MPDEVKLDPNFHVPEENPDVHLQRLLAPQDLDEPIYKSIVKTVKNIIHPPPPPPPLVLTSKPVDPKELQGLNGLYGGNETRAGLLSILAHIGVIALLVFIGSLKPVQKAVKQMVTLVAPAPPPKPVEKPKSGGGGGGARQPEVKKADLPKTKPKVFSPPKVDNFQTKLQVDPSLLNVELTDNPTDIGNLTGLSALNGSGYGGGIGSGKGGGIGSGTGPGTGPGSGGGSGGGVYKPGGDVSNPVPISRPEPQYSEEARKAKWGGTVLLSLVVDETGHTRDIKVIKPLGLGLDEKAIEAVSKWTFVPGKKGGKPVAVAAQIEVTFRLL